MVLQWQYFSKKEVLWKFQEKNNNLKQYKHILSHQKATERKTNKTKNLLHSGLCCKG